MMHGIESRLPMRCANRDRFSTTYFPPILCQFEMMPTVTKRESSHHFQLFTVLNPLNRFVSPKMSRITSERIAIPSPWMMIAMAVGIFLFTAGLVVAGDNAASQGCLVVAHRGFSRVAPENTIAAAKKAMEIGVYGSEFDVKQTKDGVAIVIHDSTVDRTTNGKGRISELSLARSKRWTRDRGRIRSSPTSGCPRWTRCWRRSRGASAGR